MLETTALHWLNILLKFLNNALNDSLGQLSSQSLLQLTCCKQWLNLSTASSLMNLLVMKVGEWYLSLWLKWDRTGEWSETSVRTMLPTFSSACVVQMWSMREFVMSVTLVGLVIIGKNEKEYNNLQSSVTQLSLFSKSKLKLPKIYTASNFSSYAIDKKIS